MNNREHQEQCALIQWCAANRKKWPELGLLFAIPNGGHRDVRVAARLKREGVRAGVPDLFLAAPRGAFAGMFIEMKVKPNKPSKLQQEFMDALAKQRYAVSVAYDWVTAAEAIREYLSE